MTFPQEVDHNQNIHQLEIRYVCVHMLAFMVTLAPYTHHISMDGHLVFLA